MIGTLPSCFGLLDTTGKTRWHLLTFHRLSTLPVLTSFSDTCNSDIATWSRDGLAFVVKDPEKFASEVIGQFFKQ